MSNQNAHKLHLQMKKNLFANMHEKNFKQLKFPIFLFMINIKIHVMHIKLHGIQYVQILESGIRINI